MVGPEGWNFVVLAVLKRWKWICMKTFVTDGLTDGLTDGQTDGAGFIRTSPKKSTVIWLEYSCILWQVMVSLRSSISQVTLNTICSHQVVFGQIRAAMTLVKPRGRTIFSSSSGRPKGCNLYVQSPSIPFKKEFAQI